MKLSSLILLSAAVLVTPSPVYADDLAELKGEIHQMRTEYEQRIQQLEKRLAQAEKIANDTVRTDTTTVKTNPATNSRNANSFNPAISMVLNSQFSNYSQETDDYELSGFSLQGESGLATKGFSLGESEMTLSASVDQLLFAQTTLALHDDEGTTEVNIEEAFIETLALSNGLTIRAGRFFSPIGYLNEKTYSCVEFC